MDFIGQDEFLLAMLKEDIGIGDITTGSCIPEGNISYGEFIAKSEGIICGLKIAERVFQLVDSRIKLAPVLKDGDFAAKAAVIATIKGPSRGILTGERVALNLLQRLSGTATATAAAVERVRDTKVRIVDTRKSTPMLRAFEKYAVRIGGGHNHRFNLADGVLIKDNHIKATGGIAQAISAVRENVPHLMKIEIETESLEQVREALDAGADIIMLDNMDTATMSKAVKLIDGRAIAEASGNMGERDIREVALSGVDVISIGALTHSVKAMDISLRLK